MWENDWKQVGFPHNNSRQAQRIFNLTQAVNTVRLVSHWKARYNNGIDGIQRVRRDYIWIFIMPIKLDEKIKEYIYQAQHAPAEIITEAHLAPLPEPVRNYLRFAGVVGKPKTRCARVKQTGLMRTSPTQNWMPVEAVQYSTLVGSLSRIWYARIKVGPITLLKGYDRYEQGSGRMVIRLLSLFPVADASGAEMDVSALIIFINDMVMWPTAFLSDYIRWESIDASSARMHVSLYNRRFSAVCHFKETGELVNFITEDRYRSVGKEFLRNKWSTPFRNYREVNGFQIPTAGEAIWHLPEDEFSYIQIKIEEVRYEPFDID
jgi:hypothetical protein